MSDHGPIEDEVRAQMNGIAEVLAGVMPENWGFTLLMFEFGNVDNGRMNYISNAPREDMITALKELVANFEGRGHKPPKRKQ
jgi:hypothetical protein